MSLAKPQKVPPAQPDACPRVYTDLIVDRTGNGEVILLHPVEARWALCNEAGLEIVGSLDGGRTLGQLAESMASDFESISSEDILEDLSAFVAELYRANLIENYPLPAPEAEKKTAPLPSLTIYTTEECNLRCRHCAIVEGRMPKPELQSQDIRRLIVEHSQAYPGATISFLGGEPLLHEEAIELLEFSAQHSPKAQVSTNGLLVDQAMARRLADSGAQVQVSLDGPDPAIHDFIRGKGTFDKAWRAIENLCEAGAAERLTVSSVLTKSLISDVKRLIDRIDSIGPIQVLRFLNLNRMRAADTHWDQIAPDPEEMKRVYKWLLFDLREMPREGLTPVKAGFPGFVPDADPAGSAWCPLGATAIVDSQGHVYNCPVFNTPEYHIGNVKSLSVQEMLEGERNRKLRKKILERRYAIEECRSCSWRNFCQGGCAAYSSLRSGDLYVNDEFCEFRRDLYREYVLRKARS